MTSPVAREGRVAAVLSQPRSFGELDAPRRVAVSPRACNWFRLPTAVGTGPNRSAAAGLCRVCAWCRRSALDVCERIRELFRGGWSAGVAIRYVTRNGQQRPFRPQSRSLSIVFAQAVRLASRKQPKRSWSGISTGSRCMFR